MEEKIFSRKPLLHEQVKPVMKIGLILECPKQGTDHQVYEYVVSELCPGIDIMVIPSVNKPALISKCGEIANLLLETENCDTVAIIWDLMPRWGGPVCRKNDVVDIVRNLTENNVDMNAVKLICMEPELEGWLIADGSALSNYKQALHPTHPVKKFNGKILPPHSKDAKKIISKYLERPYSEITVAIKIARQIKDFNKIARKHESFARLKTYVENICHQ
jgi:hypothetical protein